MTDQTMKSIFNTEIAIRWGDLDAYNHVNNTLYLRYMEEARIQLLLQMGYSLDDPKQGPVVINLQCSFLHPVTYPDNLSIECFAVEPGNSSFMTYYRLHSQKQNKLVCEGSAKIVWIDKTTNRSIALPAKLRKLIDQQQNLNN